MDIHIMIQGSKQGKEWQVLQQLDQECKTYLKTFDEFESKVDKKKKGWQTGFPKFRVNQNDHIPFEVYKYISPILSGVARVCVFNSATYKKWGFSKPSNKEFYSLTEGQMVHGKISGFAR